MLERFHVSEDEAIRVPEPKVRSATEAIFRKMGLTDEAAALSADVLMHADIHGVDTHGVSNMLRMYVKGYNEGTLNPRPNMTIERESAVTATWDGDRGNGLHTAPLAMEDAINRAEKYGAGVTVLKNSGHLGAAGYHAMMALKHDMIGVCMTGGGGFAMLPTYGAEPRFGTNPIAWAAPARNEAPFLFDVATTQVAANKIRLLQRMNRPIFANWLTDSEGTPMDEQLVPEVDIRGEGRQWYMLPFGGTRENGSHKGYGFACVVDIMCCTLSGLGPGFISGQSGHYFAAYKIDAFTDVNKFKDDMDAFLSGLAATKPAPGHERVFYPGLPEAETKAERLSKGIPYHPEVIEWFKSIGSELELDFSLT
ncbi:MAG: Ldh family oxidoreductase [Chloroflexi bacterium]|nr:Ldh family oxidoreductase [Chloroflexota bacterium]